MKDYLIRRFIINNHNKYAKYAMEWVNNITHDQMAYFVLEKYRITNGEDFIKGAYR